MGMKLQRVNFKQLKGSWEKLYSANHRLSPYSSYEYNAIFLKNYHYGWSRIFLWTKLYRLVNSSGNTIMVIPLYGFRKKYYILGDLASTGYLDFIYDETLNPKCFEEAFCLLEKKLHGSKLFLNRINEKSMLNDYLSSQYSCQRREVCVNIAFGSGYDAYMATLSKKMRHNIQTIKHRLMKDDVTFHVEVMINEKVGPQKQNEILSVYEKRQKLRYSIRCGPVINTIRRLKNPICLSTACMQGNFNAILRFNDKLAAVLCGYVTNDNRTVVIPRHAIDQAFAQYSPGMLLITETIKWLNAHSGIRNLDLSRGDEHYKYLLGGVDHYNHYYEIPL